jgi:hypothetical protein
MFTIKSAGGPVKAVPTFTLCRKGRNRPEPAFRQAGGSILTADKQTWCARWLIERVRNDVQAYKPVS